MGVRTGGMPAGGERLAVAKVACVELEEGLRAWGGKEAGPKIGVKESTAHEVGTFNGGGRARGSGVKILISIDDTPSVLARYQDCNANCHENRD